MVAAVVPVVGGQFGRFLILNVCLLRELTGQRVEHLAARNRRRKSWLFTVHLPAETAVGSKPVTLAVSFSPAVPKEQT